MRPTLGSGAQAYIGRSLSCMTSSRIAWFSSANEKRGPPPAAGAAAQPDRRLRSCAGIQRCTTWTPIDLRLVMRLVPRSSAVVRAPIAARRRGAAAISGGGTGRSMATRLRRRVITASKQRRSLMHSPSGPRRPHVHRRRRANRQGQRATAETMLLLRAGSGRSPSANLGGLCPSPLQYAFGGRQF
jgi:hypothetical protein